MNKDNRDRRKEMMNERVDDVCDRDNNVYNREKVYVYIVYISEMELLRSEPPGFAELMELPPLIQINIILAVMINIIVLR